MTAEVKTIRGIPRIIDRDTGRIAKSIHGKPLDGGRENARERGLVIARRQARHINEAQEKRHG